MNNQVQRRGIIECRGLKKVFNDSSAIQVDVLKHIDLTVYEGECVAIIGASGEGKSTLLHLLGGLDRASAGQVFIDGQDIHQISEKERCLVRNYKLGFVYQFHHLLPEFTVLENVCMPLLIRDEAIDVAKKRAEEILSKVKLSHRLQHKVGELSGGERQRTALARALVTNPLCVLADEPTGNLDHQTAEQVFKIMLDLNRDLKTSLLIVTHDLSLARQMDRVLKLENGKLVAFELK